MTELCGPSCPCGRGAAYLTCCAPLHHGERQAVTAEELMRSRYSAYARGDAAYLFRTWHPRTRPTDVALDRGITWMGLTVTETVGGAGDDVHGVVDFTARFEFGGQRDEMRERSRFERRSGRWFYVDADG